MSFLCRRKTHLCLHVSIRVFLPVHVQWNKFKKKNHLKLIFPLNQAYTSVTQLPTDSNNRGFSMCTGWRSASGTEMLEPWSASGRCLSVSSLKCHFQCSTDEHLPVPATAARQHAAWLTSMLLTLDQLQILSVV